MRRSRKRLKSSLKRLLPDTNVLVYETVEDSPHHSEAVELIDSADEIVLPAIVVHEYVWVMVKKLGVKPSLVAEKLREYLEDPRTMYVAEPPTVLYQALRLIEEHDTSPRELNDYIILSTATHYDAILASFDEKLKKIAEKIGVATLP